MRAKHFGWLSLPAFCEAAWAQPSADVGGYGPQAMWWDGGWTMMFFGPLFMVLTLVATVALVIVLMRWVGALPGWGPMLPPGKSPLDLLKDRFARGEIDKNEYEDRRRILGD